MAATAAFDAESVAMISQQRLRHAVAAVLHAEPRLQRHPAVQHARQLADWLAVAPTSTCTNTNSSVADAADADVARAYLNAMAACLVHDEFLWPIVQHLKPFCLDLMARLMDASALVLYHATTTDKFSVCADNLTRRELVASALATLLAFAPHAKHRVLQFFLESPCFFDFVGVAPTQPAQHSPTVRARLRRIAAVAYRLLQLYPQELPSVWNWSSFFPLCFADDLRVRWFAARATAAALRMSNQHRNAFLHQLEVDDTNTNSIVRQLAIDDHRFELARLHQRIELAVAPTDFGVDTTPPTEKDQQQQEEEEEERWKPVPFHASLTTVVGVVVPTNRRQDANTNSSLAVAVGNDEEDALVPTASTQRNLQALAIALGLRRPVLLAGAGGSGKTAVIRELARVSGNRDMVELHLDDQIDSKTLLGSYVCTDIPGEFTWQPGALTTAVLSGRWVVIEDIDRAPFEVLAALMPLLETRTMVLPGRGELLVAHANFQIFATTSHGRNLPKGFQASIWARVDLQPLREDEMEMILATMFARIPRHLLAKVMTTFNVVSGKLSTASSTATWKETRRNYGRDFSLRDLLKWCKRIETFCHFATADDGGYVTEDSRLRVVVEACDVFCAGIREPRTRVQAAIAIGAIWDVQDERIRYMLAQHKPSVHVSTHEIEIGRVHLPTRHSNDVDGNVGSSSFVMTGHVLRLLEKLAAIVHTCEPALLIGETGCGKTTVIQQLAASMGQKLVVQNLNIQSDSSDLVGGFKPVELHLLARPLYMSFVDNFTATFSQKSNAAFLNVVRVAFEHKDWSKMAKGMKKALQMASTKLQSASATDQASSPVDASAKMVVKGASPTVLKARWDTFDAEVARFERQREQVESHFAFAFVEGVLVKALREGHWVLLDEINLASSDTLERISTLLEHEKSAFSLTERGDVEIIRPHPNFRLFGAMNPSTDVGKKDLPPSLRNRFTEIYVDECVSPSDLQMVVQHQFKEIAAAPVMETVAFYLEARKQAEERLSDGARHKPRYSLRTLSQALQITRILIQRGYGTPRALYEGFSSTFCTLLDLGSRAFLENLIRNTFAKSLKPRDLKREPPCPGGSKNVDQFVLVSSYWVRKGEFMAPRDDSHPDPVTCRRKFVLTKSVEENLRHVSRAALIGKYPVLLQGPTSAGKTSLISYLAARIGQKCVRINNHEHTDIQEYLGSYVSDSNGKLAFKEGVLVDAVRNGWWIILDELNLAPSEVLEALNRLLDDNRELFLPETQETIKPHPKFMLFATQNPPGLYGGRKVLSRAFRNRFLEIQVDEVPTSELQTILQERSSLPPSYCSILIDIMRQLQFVRQQSSVFAGKSGFITTRDLLRWAERRPATKLALAEEGYCLLAERLRKDDEKEIVKQVIEQKCNVKIDIEAMYYRGEARESNLLDENGDVEVETVWGSNEQFKRVQQIVEQAIEGGDAFEGNAAGLDKISVTKALRRLFALVGRCLQHEEPVLLVGETGCGKTTVCQLYSLLLNQPLHIINCHQHTETSDFLGCLRPVRGKDKIATDLYEALVAFVMSHGGVAADDVADKNMDALLVVYESTLASRKKKAQEADDGMEDAEVARATEVIDRLRRRYQSIFEWCDGPLVESMKKGDLILVDEVNLAEDAVLERLNSVLEPSRTLLLAEKGGDQVEEIMAHAKWRIMATMNPGGDFGKRELSPALRNRFTEIWVPAISDLEDIATIIRDRLVGRVQQPVPDTAQLASLCDPILAFVKKFNEKNGHVGGCGAVTLRDILSWINFICSVMKKTSNSVSVWTAYVQGAALSILDGLGLGSDKALHTALKARDEAYEYLLDLVPQNDVSARDEVLLSLHATQQAVDSRIAALNSEDLGHFGITPFFIPRGPDAHQGKAPAFSLKAPTTMSNLYRVLRAMQVNRPVILEGSPGVGKTSLISALAAASGHRLVRINLSEQTDISDLFGSDLPAAASSEQTEDSAKKGMFEWCDGVFLRALKAGDWVLLDELNLASQSVLEGLNSCLDHRGTVYIPELDREFECPSTFRVFAAQNPLRQGGGRKGLPKSFLNRFTRVFVDTLHEQDLTHIATSVYPQLDVAPSLQRDASTVDDDVDMDACSQEVSTTILARMIQFNSAIHHDTMEKCTYGRLGAPWEFNLRDVFRFCELMSQDGSFTSTQDSGQKLRESLRYYVNFIYIERMRSSRDRAFVAKRFAEFFEGATPLGSNNLALRVSETSIQVGRAFLARRVDQLRVSRVVPPVFNFLLKPMEALIHCVNLNWPALLVGPPGSGKTSAVRLLAALSSNKLYELGMSAGTDATELLGCFEQVDLGRKLRETRDEIAEIVDVVLQALLRAAAGSTDKKKMQTAFIKQARQLSNRWFALVQHERDTSANGSSSPSQKKKRQQIAKGQLDSTVVDTLMEILAALTKAVDGVGASPRFSSALQHLEKRVHDVVRLSKSSAASVASSFEWVDGTLIQAMERGEWILLDNVNFCSSSVLDRLNSLMETGGELLINECGVIDGKLRVIKPHPNFRIFLAMDPQFGEVSRAMRNRCVEIALLDSADGQQPRDLVAMASSAGVPGFSLNAAFEMVHRQIQEAKAQNPAMAIGVLARFSRRHLENWAMLASREMQRGVSLLPAIRRAFERIYGSPAELSVALNFDVGSTLVKAFEAASAVATQRLLQLPASSTFDLCQQAEHVMITQDFAYVDFLLRTSTQRDGAESASLTEDQLLLSFVKRESRTEEDHKPADLQLVDFIQCASQEPRIEAVRPSVDVLRTAQQHITSVEFFPFGGAHLSVMFMPFVLRRLVQVLSSSSSRLVTEERLLFVMETLVAANGWSTDASSYLLYRYLRSLLSNKLFKSSAVTMKEAMKALVDALPTEEATALRGCEFPVYLAANAAAYNQLETIVSVHRETSIQVEQAWQQIVKVQAQLDILDGSEWLRFCEEEQYQQIDSLLAPSSKESSASERSAKRAKQQVAFDGDLAGFSVLQQSYAVHQYHADRSSIVNGDVVFLVHPFFKAFDAWMAVVLESAVLSGDEEAAELKRLIRDRVEFSIQMRDRVFDWTHFLIHWQIVKKSLAHLTPGSTITSLREWEDVVDMRQRIDDAIDRVIGCASRKNTLWKRGGHALLPRSGELWHAKFLLERLAKTHMHLNNQYFSSLTVSAADASQQVDVLALLFGGVASMEAAMKSGQLDVSSLFYVDASSRREILHALCAFSFLSKQQQSNSEKEIMATHDVMMAEELIKVPEVLLKKLQDTQQSLTALVSSKTLYLSEVEDTGANQHMLDFINSDDAEELGGRVGRDAPIVLFDLKESAKLVDQLVNFQLAPLKEHALARQEVHAIATLHHLVNVAQWTLDEDPRGCLALIQEMLATVEALIDSLVEVGLRNPATYHAYQDIVWCGHRFAAATSSTLSDEALVNDVREFISVVSSQLNSVLHGFHQFLRANSFNSMESIALEIYDTQSKRRKQRQHQSKAKHGASDDDVVDDLGLHHEVVPGLPRVFQSVSTAVILRSIAEVDLHVSKCATIETPVRVVRMQKIKDHLRSLEKAGAQPLQMTTTTVALLKEMFILTLSAFKGTFQDESNVVASVMTRWLAAETPCELAHEERAAMLRVLASSVDAGFVALLEPFVAPLLDVLTQPINTLRLGEGLVLLGLWRFLLLLPSSPVDPVTKPLVQKEMLMNRVAMATLQSTVDGAIQRFAPMPDAMHTQNKLDAINRLAQDVRRVSAFAIQRFNPEKKPQDSDCVPPVTLNDFGDLFRDLQRFQKTIMPADKLLAFVHVVRALSAKNKCRQVLRELEMFQQTTDSYLAQLTRKYSTSFFDVVEPVAASIGAIKEGVAMMEWHLHHHLQQLSAADTSKHAVALTLLQFPRAPAALAPQADLVFQLISLVGSNISALAAPTRSLASKKHTDVALLNVALTKMAQQVKETFTHAAALSASPVSRDAVATALRNTRGIFDLFLAKWQEQNEREEEKKKEEEALFKYKTRRLEIESEDELLEKEFREEFPEYTANDFGAFLPVQTAANGGSIAAAAQDSELWVSDKLTQELCEMHAKFYAACSSTSLPSVVRDELLHGFARAFALAVNMRKTINAMPPSAAIEHAGVGSSLLAASLVESRLRVGQAPPVSQLNSAYIRGVDFHRDPIVQEVVLVIQPLQNLLLKVQRLLQQWPEHAILQQIVLIADRIRNFEVSSPLVRTLTAIELLVRKAQEWENYAARAFSIAEDLKALSSLITRWRKLELYSWPHLLHVKEKQHRATAHKTWFHMYSLLTAKFEGDADNAGMHQGIASLTLDATGPGRMQTTTKKEHAWLFVNQLTRWVVAPSHKQPSGHAETDAQRQWRSELFGTIDAYLRTCPLGQYESRLLIVYAFCSQLYLEHCQHADDGDVTKRALANVLYHLYRYYAQHLGYLDRQWTALKEPIQKQLLEFVTICKWDEQTYYSLEESAEKSHRKLMKFVRDYDAVLTVSMQTVIDASTDSGISKEGGFVGLSTTKTELERMDDSVFVPVIESPVKKEEEEEEEETKDEEEDAAAKKKKRIALKKKQKAAHEAELAAANVVIVVRHDQPSLDKLDLAPATAFASLSTYAAKVPTLAKRVAKYTRQQILTLDSITQRQQPREICEELCSTIFYRMALLQHDSREKEDAKKLPKGAKKKALIDLLAELKAQGLSYHRMQLPQEQQQIEQLFALDVPDVESCLHVDGVNDLTMILDEMDGELKERKPFQPSTKTRSKAKTKDEAPPRIVSKDSPLWLWQRADDYYYRFVSQLSSLRFAALTQFSHDLSTSEVDRMSGYAENMLFRLLQHRQVLHAAALGHEQLVVALHRLEELQRFRQAYLASTTPTVAVPVAVAWQQHQQVVAMELEQPLRELALLVAQVLRTTPSDARVVPAKVKTEFDEMLQLVQQVSGSFQATRSDGRVLRKALGAPGIPFHASLSSDDAERQGHAGLVAFAHPSKRSHGISPLVLEAAEGGGRGEDGEQTLHTVVVPVGPETLRGNSYKLRRVQALLLEAKEAFVLVAPAAAFDAIVHAVDRAVEQEGDFEVSSRVEIQATVDGEWEAATASRQAFAEQFDKLVAVVLVAIQDLTKDKEEETKDQAVEEEEDASLRARLSALTTSLKHARVHAIASQLQTVLALVVSQFTSFSANSGSPKWRRTLADSVALMGTLSAPLADVRGISRQFLADFLVAHKSVAKLDYVLVRIFRNLFQHGFCKSTEENGDESSGAGDGKTKFTDDVEGTGMGEGGGKKDVSNEIEDEEQLLGLKGEENKKEEEQNKPAEDTGLEMQNDFDGTMQDMPEDDQQKNEEEEEDQEELDREMGDFDQDDENVVDEKKWGDDSDDDEDAIDEEKEKFEEDSRMDGSEAIEDEIRGKDGDEDKKEEQKQSKEEEEQSAKDKEPAKADEQAEQSGEDREDGGDEGDDDEEEEDGNKDPVNDDFEDNYEEKHDQVDPNSRDDEKEEEDKAQGDEGDELPENMQLDDGGEDDGGEDGDVDESMEPEDEEEDADAPGDPEDQADEAEEEKPEEEPMDSSVQLGAGGLDDEEDAKEDEDAAEPEADESAMENESSEQPKSSAVAGTQSKDGADELEQEEELADQSMDEEDEEDPLSKNDPSKQQKQSRSARQQAEQAEEQQDWRPSSGAENPPRESEEQKRQRRKQEPNPYRNPQSAQEHWKRRVDMIQREEEDRGADKGENSSGAKEEEMTTAELLDDDEEMEDAPLALAPADDKQVMNQQTDATEEEEKKNEEEDEGADGLGASAMEIDDEEDKAPRSEDVTEDAAEDKVKRDKSVPQPDRDHAVDSPKTKEEQEEEGKASSPPPADDVYREHEDVNMDMDESGDTASLRQPGAFDPKVAEEEEKEEEHDVAMPKLLSPEEVLALRTELDASLASSSSVSGAELWSKYTALTQGASQRLCEQLRLVLEPMLRAKLEGDFRTGKRINMRKVIPYIASQFRKDKIWMRRTRPSKRAYQIMVAIDDSESMAENHAGRLALEAMATLCKALTQLEVGEIALVKFGEEIQLLHAFDAPFTDDAGSRVIAHFTFQQKKTNMVTTLDTILQLLETAKQTAPQTSTVECTQIVFLISDGRFDTDGRTRIKKLIEKALEQQQLIVLLVVDHASNQDASILETKSVTFAKGKVEMVPYLEGYPFPYYVILPTSTLLPEILSDALRQWFEMLQMKQ